MLHFGVKSNLKRRVLNNSNNWSSVNLFIPLFTKESLLKSTYLSSFLKTVAFASLSKFILFILFIFCIL